MAKGRACRLIATGACAFASLWVVACDNEVSTTGTGGQGGEASSTSGPSSNTGTTSSTSGTTSTTSTSTTTSTTSSSSSSGAGGLTLADGGFATVGALGPITGGKQIVDGGIGARVAACNGSMCVIGGIGP